MSSIRTNSVRTRLRGNMFNSPRQMDARVPMSLRPSERTNAMLQRMDMRGEPPINAMPVSAMREMPISAQQPIAAVPAADRQKLLIPQEAFKTLPYVQENAPLNAELVAATPMPALPQDSSVQKRMTSAAIAARGGMSPSSGAPRFLSRAMGF